MLWLICHNSLPTREIISHRGIPIDNIFPRCGVESEGILHCLRDCLKAQLVWHHVGFTDLCQPGTTSVKEWIVAGIKQEGALFLADLWNIWTSRNSFIFENKSVTAWEILPKINFLSTIIQNVFIQEPMRHRINSDLRYICWEKPSLEQIALNTDGSVNERSADTGGLLRTHDSSWISGFYGNLPHMDILEAELIAVLEGLRTCWEANFRSIK
ncbi:Ribonuclease H-like superfamily [Sesbania bispinosa]|nr:Ribonuclease H-like superfamily [Sesbania bispinosa]